jgi:hypothetical protein
MDLPPSAPPTGARAAAPLSRVKRRRRNQRRDNLQKIYFNKINKLNKKCQIIHLCFIKKLLCNK